MAVQLGQKGLRADINVTPLVDVMLVLLIIFMVITPMLQRGKPVQLPQVSKPEKQPDNGKDLVVSLEYTGSRGGPPGSAVKTRATTRQSSSSCGARNQLRNASQSSAAAPFFATNSRAGRSRFA